MVRLRGTLLDHANQAVDGDHRAGGRRLCIPVPGSGRCQPRRVNLIEALELFFETADASEIQSRMHSEVFVTRLEVAVG